MIINGYFIGFAGTHKRDDNCYRVLAETIGEEIMKRGHRLVSGGCSGGLTQNCAKNASSYLKNNKRDGEIDFRIISVLPDPQKDTYNTIDFGNKFECQGLTREDRRPVMASLMDALITIEGGGGTRKEIEACLKVSTPIIPLWPTGGASLEYWNNIKLNPDLDLPPYCFYKGNTISRINELGEPKLLNNQNQAGIMAVDIAIELAKKKHEHRCIITAKTSNTAFIIMPFHEKFDAVCSSIKQIFEKKIYYLPKDFQCIRHDEVPSGKIDSSLFQHISEASLLIVDLTGNNPNVLCEYGMGIGLGKKMILINQSPENSVVDIANDIQIKYEPTNLEQLKEKLIKAIQDKYKGHID